jgi:titin
MTISVPPVLKLDKDFEDTIIMKANTSKIVQIPFAASPMPEVTWTFNEGKFSDAKRITIETIRGVTALTISRAERKDAGEYQVTIKNKFGTLTHTIKVIVLDKPSPPRNLKVPEVTPESARLTWEVPEDDGGSPITGYIVEKRDINRQSWNKITTTKELTSLADKLIEKNQYVFRVSAENDVGVSEPVETAPVTAKWTFGKFSL